jgi:hypothetical protein
MTRFTVVVVVALLVSGASSAGQERAGGPSAKPAPASKAWTPPRTADGQPDLQGVWLNGSATPFERPKALEGKAVLTDDEVAELRRRADRLFKDGNADLPVGDNLFLAALANPESYRNPNGANRSSAFMVEREFDNRTSLIVDPSDGRQPPLTPEGQQRRAAAAARDRVPEGPEDINNTTRCITPGTPRMGAGAGGDPQYGYYQIVQSPGYVVLLMETYHDARIVPLDGRPHLSQAIRQWSGDSRGKWEGNTLVVETSNFSPKSNFLGSAQNLRLVERFTRVAPNRINYEVSVDDKTTWTSAWTAMIHLKKVQAPIYEFACHEGNVDAMTAVLENARRQDARGAKR